MRILILSTYDSRGGAANCAYLLGKKLHDNGDDVQMLVNYKTKNDDWIIEIKGSKVFKKIFSVFDSIPILFFTGKKNIAFGLGFWGHSIEHYVKEFNPDIINVHWIGKGFVSLFELKKINVKYPILWSAHDWWLSTEGTYNSSSGGVFENYAKLLPPIVPQNFLWKKFCKYWSTLKMNILSKMNIFIAFPSNAMKFYFSKSLLTKKFQGETIYNGIDTDKYHFYKDEEIPSLKEKYGLNKYKKYLFFNTTLNDNVKGYDLLHKLLKTLEKDLIKRNIGLIAIGDKNPFKTLELDTCIECHYFGYVKDKCKLSDLFTISKMTIISSRFESFSLLAAESVLCGTPVLAFNVGGIPEAVGKYGVLVKPYNVPLMKFEILKNISKSWNRNEMHLFIKNTFSLNIYFKKYHNCMIKLLKN